MVSIGSGSERSAWVSPDAVGLELAARGPSTAGRSTLLLAADLADLPPWPRKVRVGANSPSLCPTMSSVTYSLMKFLPLWIAKFLPMNSGTIVQARAQVLIGSRLPVWLGPVHLLEQPLDDVRAFLQRTSHGPCSPRTWSGTTDCLVQTAKPAVVTGESTTG